VRTIGFFAGNIRAFCGKTTEKENGKIHIADSETGNELFSFSQHREMKFHRWSGMKKNGPNGLPVPGILKRQRSS
jgi:hypothetical protein